MNDEKLLQDRLMAIFTRRLPAAFVERALVSDSIDITGSDVLLVTFVLTQEGADQLTGDLYLDLLVDVQKCFEASGDSRFPIIGYATQAELDEKDAA